MSFYPIFITAFIFIFKKSNAFLDAAACDIGTPCLGGYECLNGNCLTLCGGIAGFSCQDGYTCVDDPTDNCDPSNGGADCAGICVVEPPLLCVDDSECVSNMWCRDIQDSNGGCGNNKECVPYAIEGESCEAFTLPCYFEKCSPDMTCFHSNPMLPDLPGICQSNSGSTAYNLVNVGSAFTEMEANDYCISNYGTTLATINTQSDYNSARHISINGNPTNGNLQLTTTGGSSEWWFAVQYSGLPDGYKIKSFEVEDKDRWIRCHIANWATSCTAGYPPFSLPLSVRITASNGEQIVANDVIKNYNDGMVWDLKTNFGPPIEEPWIGMINKKEPPFFEWLSDDICLDAPTGACVPAKFWVDKQPINCDKSGTDCVIFYKNGFNNDIECDTQRRTFLCNRNLFSVKQGAHIVNMNELKGFGASESYFDGITNWTLVWILLALSVMCNMMYSLYCLYIKWCKKRSEDKRYNVVGDEDEVEGLNDI
eukprot:453617_1